jgi:hypothetical protein
MKELIHIQAHLKAPKGQYNSFGKYKYRSCEDILEGVKPLLKQYKCVLILSDSIETRGSYNYVEAHATLVLPDGKKITVTGIAREAETQKGMNPAQITGSTSSYARKYALNGLFAIDDTKDDDTRKPPTQNDEMKILKDKFEQAYNKIPNPNKTLKDFRDNINQYSNEDIVKAIQSIQKLQASGGHK